MSSLQKLEVKIVGTTGLCMHNIQMADPLCQHPLYAPFKKLSSKRAKTEEDHIELARLEWALSLYVNAKGQLYLPGRGIEAALKDTAKRQKLGKKFNASVMVDDAILDFPGKAMSLDELWASGKYSIRQAMKVSTARVMRTTPRFNEWSANIAISFLASEIDPETIMSVLRDAGRINGMFEFRPRYGRFEVQ